MIAFALNFNGNEQNAAQHNTKKRALLWDMKGGVSSRLPYIG